MRTSTLRIILASLALVATTSAVNAQGQCITSYAGVPLYNRECVPAARDLASKLLGRSIPYLGVNGGAKDLWTVATPGWTKIGNTGKNIPSMSKGGALVVWGPSVGNGYGHVALVLGVANPTKRTVWVVEANWYLGSGSIREAQLDGKVLGWLMPS